MKEINSLAYSGDKNAFAKQFKRINCLVAFTGETLVNSLIVKLVGIYYSVVPPAE